LLLEDVIEVAAMARQDCLVHVETCALDVQREVGARALTVPNTVVRK